MSSASKFQREKPRKRPLQERSRKTVEAMVEAAARILESGGFDALTTNRVAEVAGVSVGSLYQYFPDKASLVAAVIVRETSMLLVDAQAAASGQTGVGALRGLIEAAIRHQFARPALARLLDFEEARMPFDSETARVRQEFQRIISTVLARADVPAQPSLSTSAADVAAIIQGMLDAAGARGERDARSLLERVHGAVFGYLEAQSASAGR
jgi:AcrR family transcriptional regulator